jgi:tetratricopeptide (TPR) repeat protein
VQEAANLDVQHARAVIIAALADLEQEEGNLELAHTMIDEVLRLRQRLAAAAPHDRTRQADLSIAIVRKGDIVGQSTDWRNAMPYYHEALAMDERLIAAEPEHPRFASNLAWSYDRLGARHRLFGEHDIALEYFRRNLAWLAHLETLSVKPDDLARCRASAYTHLAILANARDDLRGALEDALRARAAADVALKVASSSRLAALASCSAWAMLGNVQTDLGWYAEAMTSFEAMYQDAYPLYLRDPLDRWTRAKFLAAISWGGQLAIRMSDAEAEAVWRDRWLDIVGSLEGWPPPEPGTKDDSSDGAGPVDAGGGEDGGGEWRDAAAAEDRK